MNDSQAGLYIIYRHISNKKRKQAHLQTTLCIKDDLRSQLSEIIPQQPLPSSLARLSVSPSLHRTLISADSSRWSQMAVTICRFHHAACKTALAWCLEENFSLHLVICSLLCSPIRLMDHRIMVQFGYWFRF